MTVVCRAMIVAGLVWLGAALGTTLVSDAMAQEAAMPRDVMLAIAEAGGLPTAAERARYRAEGAFAASLCCQAVDLVFTASGGGGRSDNSDVHAQYRPASRHAGRVRCCTHRRRSGSVGRFYPAGGDHPRQRHGAR